MRRFWRLCARGARLRCPICGKGRLFRAYFTPHDRCGECGFVYARGNEYGREGYFTGAMALNLVLTGVVPLVALFVLAVTTRLPAMTLTAIGVTWAIIFPIVFYPYSCALWLVLDHLMNPPTVAELAGQTHDTPTPSPLSAQRRRSQKGPDAGAEPGT